MHHPATTRVGDNIGRTRVECYKTATPGPEEA